MKKAIILTLVLALALTAGTAWAADSGRTKVKVGVTGEIYTDIWEPAIKELAAEGIDIKDKGYVNIVAARIADKDSPVFKRIVKAFHSDAVKRVLAGKFKGSLLPVWED